MNEAISLPSYFGISHIVSKKKKMHTVEILANKKHRVPRWKYGMLSASLDLKNRSMFLLTFAPLPVCAEKETEPESQPKYICISPNLPNPHSHEGTQPDPQSYLIDPEA